jgi:hypothetical protein
MSLVTYNFKSFKFPSEADAFAWWEQMSDPANPNRWYARVDSGWWGVCVDVNPIATPAGVVDVADDFTGIDLEDWEPISRLVEMSGTSTAWRVVVEAGPNTHLNARLGKYLSPAQHKVPIHETYLDLISPKLVEHRVYKQGLKWKTYYAHPDDVERNALGELTPTNGRTWDEIALAIKEYRHVIGVAGPQDTEVRITWPDLAGGTYYQLDWALVAKRYGLRAQFRTGSSRRSEVVATVQSLIYSAALSYAVAVYGTPDQVVDVTDLVALEAYVTGEMNTVIGTISADMGGSGVDALTAYVTGNSSVLLDAVQNTTLLPSATFPWLDVPVDYVGTSTVCRTALTSDLTPPVPSNGYIFG